MNQHVWWYLARSTGIVAWVLSAASVLWGLALSTRALGARPKAPWLLDLHRFLGGLTVLFVGGHVASLVADSYIDFGPREILVPFASSWRPLPVAFGVVTLYLLVAVEVTSLARKHLPKRVWRAVHLSSYVVYLAASVHFLTAGSDAANDVARVAVVVTGALMAFFFVYLVVGPGKAASVRTGGASPRTAARVPGPIPARASARPGRDLRP